MRPQAVLTALLVLAACGEGSPPKEVRSAGPDPVWSNPAAAAERIDKALTEHIAVRDGLLVVRESDAETTVSAMPLTVPWRVTCGVVGLRVIIGYSAGGDSEGIPVPLSEVLFPTEHCEASVAIAAKKMQALTAARP